MLREAQIYLEMGWAVYPVHSVSDGLCSCGGSDCPAPGKHPIGRWSDYQNRLPTSKEITTWFTAMPDCNIGMVTGEVSSVVVVDVDGVDGLESSRELNLAPTLSARTGGGGYHFFYSIREPRQSRVRIRKGIDVRGDDRFVVLPPSRHVSGKLYRWLQPRGMVPYVPIAKAPAVSTFGDNRAGWSGELVGGVSEGSRSISAARLAGRYLGLGLTLEEVWLLMSGWNERNRPPMIVSELHRTVAAVARKHKENSSKRVETFSQIRAILEGGADA